MAKIAVLLPKESMLEQTRRVIEEEKPDVTVLKVIRTTDSVREARNAVKNGAEIVVARGAQASSIKTYTDIPLAEIRMTGQEMGLLVQKAKRLLQKKCPIITVIGYENMYGDMSYFDEIFSIILKTHFIKSQEEIRGAVENAVSCGTDLIIGGDTVNELSRQHSIPTLFIESTEDSIRNAIRMAKRMGFMAEIEKRHIAQFETLLDTTRSGIIKIDRSKKITIANKMVGEIIGGKIKELKGKKIEEVIPELKSYLLDSVLGGQRDTVSTSVKVGNTPVMVTVSPVQVKNEICGVIISLHRLSLPSAEKNRAVMGKGFQAQHNFSDLNTEDESMQSSVEQGKIYALSAAPVLIYGEVGTEKTEFAQCIHNNSRMKNGPFICVNIEGMTAEKQIDYLFGDPESKSEIFEKGALVLGNSGSVYISGIGSLSMEGQYRLYRSIRQNILFRNNLERYQPMNTRIIVSSEESLEKYVDEGKFRLDLYYLLNSLVIKLHPLRKRKKDIVRFVEQFQAQFAEKYLKFLRIPEDTMNFITECDWPGNEIQLATYLERLFLTVPRKTVGEAYARNVYKELYGDRYRKELEKGTVVTYENPEEEKIRKLLDSCHGSRKLVADELGISTTTLWRRMKKYGIIDPV